MATELETPADSQQDTDIRAPEEVVRAISGITRSFVIGATIWLIIWLIAYKIFSP